MAAYEVLLLNTAIPQIQAAQSGDTYVVPRDIAINATAIISANSATDALRITQTGAGNAILVEDSANPDATPFVVTAAGDVGIGTTLPAYPLHVVGNVNGAVTSGVTNSNAGTSSVARFIAISDAGNATFGMTSSGYTDISGASDALLLNANNASNGMAFALDGNVKMKLDSSGNLGLGVTPSAWGASIKAQQIGSAYSLGFSAEGDDSSITTNAYKNTSGTWVLQSTSSYKPTRYNQFLGKHIWSYGASGSANAAASFTEAMTLDASGNLVVGATSTSSRFEAVAGTGAQDIARFRTGDATAANNAGGGFYANSSATAGSRYAYLWLDADGANFSGLDYFSIYKAGNSGGVEITNSSNSFMTFGTSGTEKARITSGGYFKASDNGTYNSGASDYHEFNQSAALNALEVYAGNASYNANVVIALAARNTTNNSFYYFGAYNTGAAAFKFRVADSGDVTNTNGTYGTISDAKMKTDIVDAGSQWSDIKALRFRKFKMKNDPSGLVQLGVVAQEVELTSPGLVDEHADKDAEGNDLGTTTKSVKTSVLLMKAAVALQEAMARIETLEAEVAALKGA